MREDIKDLMLNNVQTDDVFADSGELYDHLDYSGGVHEIIDSSIDVYYYDLRKWAVDNYDFIDEAIESGLVAEGCDFHTLIQVGQYVALNAEAVELVEELFQEYKNKLFKTVEPKAEPVERTIKLEGSERDAYIAERFPVAEVAE
ncbi:hypothetical protein N9Y51_04590 [Alphaproteobacteria bacterium]|nr:hypothetical protein [Alphaproteobacteria bacterium]